MRCPQCNATMKAWRFDLGYGITVPSRHCTRCQFNVTDENVLTDAMERRRERSSKDVRVVAIGDGIGIRFPKEIVEEYAIKKGVKVTLKPGKNGIEVLL